MALLPADRVIACEHAWLSPIQPEGASEILYRDTDHLDGLHSRCKVGTHPAGPPTVVRIVTGFHARRDRLTHRILDRSE